MIGEILNFHPLTDRIATGGQPTTEQLRSVADHGYRAVINLAMHDSDGALAEEGNLVASLGMQYFHIPVPFDAPDATHLRRFCGLMDLLADEKVFVHCAVNARVSAFTYQYLTLLRGQSPEESTTPLLRLWLPEMDERWRGIMALTAADIS